MYDTLDVDAYVAVRTGCGMRCVPLRDEEVEVTFGPQRSGFTMLFSRESLQAFVELATDTLELPEPADDEDEDSAVGGVAEVAPVLSLSPLSS